jgi:hypothetical protein
MNMTYTIRNTEHGTTQSFFEHKQDNLGTKGEMNAPHRHAMQFMVSARHDRILLGPRHEISTVQLRTKQFLQGASRHRRGPHSAVDDDPASHQHLHRRMEDVYLPGEGKSRDQEEQKRSLLVSETSRGDLPTLIVRKISSVDVAARRPTPRTC